ncbi:DNA-directed RNA polymerase III, subunit Rpc31 [Phellopilus nigrolimitatus]|nr:DNA-directed RNA polymerase III, subunit Rpc31 [Phellopilus nigrolimitatus]
MSRGGRGGGRGGRGGFGAGALPPMGLTFADIQNMSREAGELYPAMDPLPVLTSSTEEERKICALQAGFTERLRTSKYYVVEVTKSDELPRYSDKYRPSPDAQPTLKRKELHQPFFPSEIFEDYFNPKRRKREKKAGSKKIKLDDLAEGEEDQENSSDKASDAGSQAAGSEDYDVDEEYDNDYAENYFDNGEGDDMDDLGDGGAGGGDGGDE